MTNSVPVIEAARGEARNATSSACRATTARRRLGRELDRALAINPKGVLYGCQAALRVMGPQKSGSIVNVSSAVIDAPAAGYGVYALTRARIASLRGIIIALGLLTFVDSTGIAITPILASLGSLAVSLALKDSLAKRRGGGPHLPVPVGVRPIEGGGDG